MITKKITIELEPTSSKTIARSMKINVSMAQDNGVSKVSYILTGYQVKSEIFSTMKMLGRIIGDMVDIEQQQEVKTE